MTHCCCSNTLSRRVSRSPRTWLLTRQETMVAPCRLMVQVVLLPRSMGTTGTWLDIAVRSSSGGGAAQFTGARLVFLLHTVCSLGGTPVATSSGQTRELAPSPDDGGGSGVTHLTQSTHQSRSRAKFCLQTRIIRIKARLTLRLML